MGSRKNALLFPGVYDENLITLGTHKSTNLWGWVIQDGMKKNPFVID